MARIVETAYGKISGISVNGCSEYLGIPYAKAPISDLAFRHPEDPEPWDGLLKAEKGGRNSIQGYSSRHYISYTGQDCLYMNICVPDDAGTDLPVLVWIHGGSYATGGTGRINEQSDNMVYDLTRFARETDAILVDFNYRLNLYGFMNLNCLSPRFDMNCGLYQGFGIHSYEYCCFRRRSRQRNSFRSVIGRGMHPCTDDDARGRASFREIDSTVCLC